MVRRIVPRRQLPWWQGVLLAAGVSAGAWLLRYALSPVLVDQMPYTVFFLATLAASMLGGWKAGLTAIFLSGLAANFSFVSDGHGLVFDDSRGWGFAIFMLVSLVLVSLVHALASSLRRETTLAEELTTVSAEYRHRIKNLIAVSQSLVRQSARGAGSVHEFREKALERLHALGRAQDLLDARAAHSVTLDTLIKETLEPYALERRLATPMSGPEVLVPAGSTIGLALLFNELATNATKHGALSVDGGLLQIGWRSQGEWIVIEWKETGGPPVAQPSKPGFGSRLVRNALAQSGGGAELAFEPDGLRCVMKLRARAHEPEAVGGRGDPEAAPSPVANPRLATPSTTPTAEVSAYR